MGRREGKGKGDERTREVRSGEAIGEEERIVEEINGEANESKGE